MATYWDPFSHALAVSLTHEDDPQTYAQDFYQLDIYHTTYANAVFPSNTDAAAANTVVDPLIPLIEDDLLPPNTHRQPGRQKKRRICGGTEGGDRGASVLFAAVTVVPQATRRGHAGSLSRRC